MQETSLGNERMNNNNTNNRNKKKKSEEYSKEEPEVVATATAVAVPAPFLVGRNRSPSRKLVLYTKPGCCLCDGLKEKPQAAFLVAGPDSLHDVHLQIRSRPITDCRDHRP
ncbi:PREDICTED: uncharacterized protein LOC104601377 [Nelumbo nucifera]|uniref:Uncharacterized protein LOC104601377 n=2 Tax=Nelumbo nucifera TaxID=4432 RepID=A0A1U8Q596_NELNU|nr:PREDICTED: uncharacterized protein LOC104601377 [Nelumbo nucifera]DAD28928.1 TPA_asm: hypothetical protein HUJ06_030396 [Nelumbo nucifera]